MFRKFYVDGVLKAVQQAFREGLPQDIRRNLEGGIREEIIENIWSALRAEFRDEPDEIRRQLKGKATDTGLSVTSAVTPALPPPPPFFPPSVPTSDLSTTDLKTFPLSRLLDKTSVPTREGIDLITMLCYHLEPPSPPQTPDIAALLATIAERDAQLAARDETIRRLQEQVAALEETCRAQSQGTKRGHDDLEDLDRHEGEKRHKL